MRVLLLLLLIHTANIASAQEFREEINSIDNQFDKIYKKATNYKNYKVILKEQYLNLKLNVLDSIKDSKRLIFEIENRLHTKNSTLKKTKEQLVSAEFNLKEVIQKANSMTFMGVQLNKTSYNLLLWLLIIFLISTSVYFIFKYKKSMTITKEAQRVLLENEKALEIHQKKSLVREQKLRRQLQDEINKQKK
ncbi:MAG: hypothetical protein P8K12_03800 [Polaribacter sp.]|nr:hypothetical protein [Polaribacter sp.]